ncbi:Hypothetical predicted protein [Pelobates cultripes]|uniref:Uncharacterized protein n=1 Tax=Pelobates cultripes TaxID=61616 RepID=A0AAD1WTN2_PELCU|nr:Hypothetical predicted protein [Pelobates cultripes]
MDVAAGTRLLRSWGIETPKQELRFTVQRRSSRDGRQLRTLKQGEHTRPSNRAAGRPGRHRKLSKVTTRTLQILETLWTQG